MKKLIGKIIIFLECVTIITVTCRFYTLKGDLMPVIKNTVLVVNDIYQESLQPKSEAYGKEVRNSIEVNIEKLLGTWTTTCDIPARTGYSAVKWSITGINKVNPEEIQANFNGKLEPCPISNIHYNKGSIGDVELILNKWDGIENWIMLLGVILVFLKIIESFVLNNRLNN